MNTSKRAVIPERLAVEDWNQRLLTILLQTYPSDARLMALLAAEGEKQNQAYAERLSAYYRKIESEKSQSART